MAGVTKWLAEAFCRLFVELKWPSVRFFAGMIFVAVGIVVTDSYYGTEWKETAHLLWFMMKRLPLLYIGVILTAALWRLQLPAIGAGNETTAGAVTGHTSAINTNGYNDDAGHKQVRDKVVNGFNGAADCEDKRNPAPSYDELVAVMDMTIASVRSAMLQNIAVATKQKQRQERIECS